MSAEPIAVADADPLEAPPELLRVATAGSVDDGKSTLIGRLLYDTKSILEDQIEAIESLSRERGDEAVDLSLLTDGLRAEREQGITIDVAYRYFATPRRSFILADTPGHVRYTRNMVTGASTADLALVLIDARNGVVEQSKRHAYIAATLRVPHLVAVVNKMDLVNWSEKRFRHIAAEFRGFCEQLGVEDVAVIPVSALEGDNVVESSENLDWYEEAPLLRHLECIDVAGDREAVSDLRFPVQWVVRPRRADLPDYRGYAGQVAGGELRVGDEVAVLPQGDRSKIAAIDALDESLDEAVTPMAVTVRLEDDLDISRGDVICHPHALPAVAREVRATVCWLDETPAKAGTRYVLKQAAREARATLAEIVARVDVGTLRRHAAPEQLELNDIGEVVLHPAAPLVVDPYATNRTTGAFVLVEEASNATVGAGMVLAAGDDASRPDPTQLGEVDRATRWERLGQHGATVWLTGLPSSGKTTIATALEASLLARGRSAYVVDGDTLRHGLCGDLGFSPGDREENVRRAGELAKVLADSGTVAIVTLVSPYRAHRDQVRERHSGAELAFVEAFVDTPLEECERRDHKGLYRRARAGELDNLTGVDAPYEPPEDPELVVDGTGDVAEAVEGLEAQLARRGVL